jgi:hypothetical protein
MAAIPDSLMSTVRPFKHTARPGLDSDVNLNFESGVDTGVGNDVYGAGCALILSFRSRLSPLSASAAGQSTHIGNP